MEDLKNRYNELCGNFGKTIFEEKVLPSAKKLFTPKSFNRKMRHVIKQASECKQEGVDAYLEGIAENFEAKLEKRRGKEPLERKNGNGMRLLIELEAELMKYNQGVYSNSMNQY